MRQLDARTLQALYPAPDAAFAQRMRQQAHTLTMEREEPTMKRFSLRLTALTTALLLLLALTAAAVTLTRPAVLDWLLGNAPASEELTQAAQTINAEATADGVTLRVTSVVYDGDKLAFAYEAEAEDPTQAAIFALEPVMTINGQEVRISEIYEAETCTVPSLRLDLAPVTRNPVQAGQMVDSLAGLTGEVECTLTFRIYRPEKAFAFLIGAEDALRHIDEQSADYQADLRDQLTTMESLRNAIIPGIDQQDAAYWVAEGYTVEGENLKETAAVKLTFTFNADNILTHDFSGTADIPLDGATMQVERLLLTPLQTVVDVRLIPQENTEAAAQALMAQHGAAILTDTVGTPVAYSHMDYEGDGTPYVTCMDGQWVCRYAMQMPGLAEFPESVGFVTQDGELARFDLTEK